MPAAVSLAAAAPTTEEFLGCRHSPKTRHAYRSDLKLFYAWAMRRCGFEANPVDDTDPIRVGRPLPRPLTIADTRVALRYGDLRTARAARIASC